MTGAPVEVAYEQAGSNMKEEAVEFARIINEHDYKAADNLHAISLMVVEITEDLRKQNNILFRRTLG